MIEARSIQGSEKAYPIKVRLIWSRIKAGLKGNFLFKNRIKTGEFYEKFKAQDWQELIKVIRRIQIEARLTKGHSWV